MPIKVSKNEWMALSAEQQTQIAGIIDTNFAGQTIEPAEGGTAIVQVGSVCEIACDVAQSAAISECKKLPFGRSICIAIAKEAGSYCRDQC
ncbi:hypothetical protein [Sphingomonas faeni]|uniref:hypothetical protein n=1 Tax=Sphingomonas faeni TaxID=185950 RepID=UPI00278460D2|nr:hypothetical protein [Sphingomonas faeni]MDQ0838912.1 hypothetical protein [Sphingomonas faeni]